MSDKMREEFEDFASDQYEWPQAIQKNGDGEYKLMATAEGWRYWQASRAALVVELPDSFRVNLQECFAADEVIDAIHATGVTTK